MSATPEASKAADEWKMYETNRIKAWTFSDFLQTRHVRAVCAAFISRNKSREEGQRSHTAREEERVEEKRQRRRDGWRHSDRGLSDKALCLQPYSWQPFSQLAAVPSSSERRTDNDKRTKYKIQSTNTSGRLTEHLVVLNACSGATSWLYRA